MKFRIVALPIFFVLASLGCSNDDPVTSTVLDDFVPPEFVYVPGDGHKTDLVIEIIGDVSIRSAAMVSAQAISGPWKKVRYSDIEPCSTWFVRPLDETDITGSVEWSTNLPDKVVLFQDNTPIHLPGIKDVRSLVMWAAAGVGSCHARNHVGAQSQYRAWP